MPLAQVKPAAAQRGTVEQTYQKLTQREHILQRPDTYVGSVEAVTQDGWVFDAAAGRMAQRKLTYVPGLYKIFDEILVNAADNKQRDTSMSEIRVEIDAAAGRISVQNNGKGVPVVMHQEHGIYVPELIFGHLLTSSNYNDNQKKVTGGRNGYGAKLANIFSSEFVVETSDSAEARAASMPAARGRPAAPRRPCDEPPRLPPTRVAPRSQPGPALCPPTALAEAGARPHRASASR